MHERNLGIGLLLATIILVLISQAAGCSSGPQLVPATAPNTTTVNVTCTTGGSENPAPASAGQDSEGMPSSHGTNAVLVWVDNSNSANPNTVGNQTDASVPISASVPVNLPGGTSTTPASTPASTTPHP